MGRACWKERGARSELQEKRKSGLNAVLGLWLVLSLNGEAGTWETPGPPLSRSFQNSLP